MIKIAICDDDLKFSKVLEQWVRKICFSRTEYEIQCFEDGKNIIQEIEKGEWSFDLLILDINMQYVDGMKVAEYIRNEMLDMDIIFLTVSRQYVYQGYKYKAFAYLLKPVHYEELREELVRYLDEREEVSEVLNVSVRGCNVKIPLKNVLYFMSEKRVITAVLKTEKISFYEKLDKVSDRVENVGFVRCHQSYLVNQKYIIQSSASYIVLENQAQIPISRTYAKKGNRGLGRKHTKSLAMSRENYGAIICVAGEYVGKILRLKPDEEIHIGRDAATCNLVLHAKEISRNHCIIRYDYQVRKYYVTDISKNGVMVCFHNQRKLLTLEKEYELEPETEMILAGGNERMILG